MPGPRAAAPALILLATTTAALAFATPASAAPAPGAPGLGDPFFPNAGNGGYDVGHYDLAIRYRPSGNRLRGRARISATATEDLSSFDLDYRGPKITSLSVDEADATFDRQGQELIITPEAPIASGSPIEIEVSYRGHPHEVTDPDGSPDGWITTDDGAYVAAEPQGAPTWFPCNDYPSDKASFAIRLTVPRGIAAISNGALAKQSQGGRWERWNWVERQPMAPYLATATIGRFHVRRGREAGIRSVIAVDPREAHDSKAALALMPRILRLFKRLYGPYPFHQVGAAVDRAPAVGYSLETQTRPVFDRAPDDVLLAHELSHQWFGDSVSLDRWPDMWLNEGFATWSEWRWAQANGGISTAHQSAKFARMPDRRADVWAPPPAAIGAPKKLFADSVYVRGGMALEALRQRIGNLAFYATLRAWAAAHRHANAGIDQFIALAEVQSGQQLDDFFQAWLYQPGKPAVIPAPGS